MVHRETTAMPMVRLDASDLLLGVEAKVITLANSSAKMHKGEMPMSGTSKIVWSSRANYLKIERQIS
jgi:hypothetical protein